MVRALSTNYEDFAGASRPFRAHAELDDLEVEGEIPLELCGTFYRVSHDPYYERDYYEGGAKTTSFDADGSISAFRIEDGKASFKQRYVLTERFLAERKAGRAMFGVMTSPFSHHPCVRSMEDNVANTNIIVHAGKLLALGELGAPYELDPNTMATVGHNPFPGQIPVNGPYTAHPKVDPDTGELVGFGYGLKGAESNDCTVWILDRNGKKTFERPFERVITGFIHDCAITRNYIVLQQMPFRTSFEQLKTKDGHLWTYDEGLPTYFYIVPRDMDKPVRTFHWKNSMPIHTGACWEEGRNIIFDTTVASSNTFPFLRKSSASTGEPKPVTVNYVRFSIDPNAVSEEVADPEILVDLPCEFPRIDERFLTKRSRYTFLDCFNPESMVDPALVFRGLNCLGRFDSETRKLEIMSPGPGVLVQEPCFSPRYPEAPEGDGFLITMIDNVPKLRNEVIIQDTKDFQNIVARIVLPFRASSP
ncbi:hypothetical protein ASPVEDRAFT_122213 [Aspergillus versicolor CBS 583.65]|uniref:Carotenoid oxygenase n=1 Tax=Aspergillus versicolor CBS 583.65 TaxID=1036611 RepID=A0A1L9P3W6_ASPVE|nr:uncharacterized protein ASPVEDRAFT_122213 [Aspergillus versicolor CBS 583.65]OJI96134.1 hypothetical protein ASPVEDRAFT_122213 [Aspergillus versicolor CBS 583.65]